MYLAYETEQDATERADEEGRYLGYSYWTQGTGTRWLTRPMLATDGKWVLDVSDYELDSGEQAAVELTYDLVQEVAL